MTQWTRHRLAGIDAARGLALLGMVAAHTLPRLEADGTLAPAFVLVAGRASALFAVLAGVGLVLLTRWDAATSARTRARDRVAIVVRAVLLMLLGMLLAEVDSGVAVILVFYGLMFVLATPFLGLRARALASLAVGVLVLMPVASHLVRPLLPAGSGASPGLDFFDGSFWAAASELTLTGFYPALPWMAYLLAGMAVGRLRLRDRGVAAALLVGGVLLAVGARLASGLLLSRAGGLDALRGQPELFGRSLEQSLVIGLPGIGTTPTGTWWWLAVATPHTATPFDLATTIGAALAVIGLCLLVLPQARIWAMPLLALGGMSLTTYCLHVLLLGTVMPPTMPYAFAAHAVVLTFTALAWRALVGQGPLELLTQRLSRQVARLAVPPRRADLAAAPLEPPRPH